MTTNLYNQSGEVKDNQSVYDAFNDFMFSSDRNVFNKLLARIGIYSQTSHLHGDIVECGVYKGTGMLTWLKAMDVQEHHSIKKVIGFDMFAPDMLLDTIKDDIDNRMMKQVFDRSEFKTGLSLTEVHTKISNAGFDSSKFDLVRGDIAVEAPHFVQSRPGFRISILYLDLDIYEPTYAALSAFHTRVVPGGIIVFDEYAYQSWSETAAAERFMDEFGDEYDIYKLDFKAPTLMMVKK